MTDQELEDARNLNEVAKMMDMPGWMVCLVSLNAERENIIRIVAGGEAKGPKHGWEYYQGLLAGFQRATDIFDRMKKDHDDLLEIERQEREERADEREAGN